MKLLEKEKAIALRHRGFTYSEILKEVPAAKSTLSIWLRSVGLATPQKQRITEKRLAAGLRGAEARRRQRILLTQQIQQKAIKDIKRISKRELWLIGAILYWAEGAKEREHPGMGVQFINSDPYMIKVFLSWLQKICKVKDENIQLEIYIHENNKDRIKAIIRHWSTVTGFPRKRFSKIYFKKHNPKTNRKNIGNTYFGLLKIRVKSSSSLNRRIAGWVMGVIQSLENRKVQ